MSGGSYEYAYRRVHDMADTMEHERGPMTPERAAFAAHLRLVAEAMRAVEWVDSCDDAPGRENVAIAACLRSTAVSATVAERDAAHALLARIVKYAREDRARTPGFTRLARALSEAEEMIRTAPPQPARGEAKPAVCSTCLGTGWSIDDESNRRRCTCGAYRRPADSGEGGRE